MYTTLLPAGSKIAIRLPLQFQDPAVLKKKTSQLIWLRMEKISGGINAVRVLSKENAFTIDKTIAAGYDTYLAAFEHWFQHSCSIWKKTQPGHSLFASLEAPVSLLKKLELPCCWKFCRTTLAIEWAQNLISDIRKINLDEGEDDQVAKTKKFAANATADALLLPLQKAVKDLTEKFGKWQNTVGRG